MTAKICAVLFVGALLTACTSSTQGSSGSAGTSSAGTSVETSAVPSGGFLVDLDTRVITPLQSERRERGRVLRRVPRPDARVQRML